MTYFDTKVNFDLFTNKSYQAITANTQLMKESKNVAAITALLETSHLQCKSSMNISETKHAAVNVAYSSGEGHGQSFVGYHINYSAQKESSQKAPHTLEQEKYIKRNSGCTREATVEAAESPNTAKRPIFLTNDTVQSHNAQIHGSAHTLSSVFGTYGMGRIYSVTISPSKNNNRLKNRRFSTMTQPAMVIQVKGGETVEPHLNRPPEYEVQNVRGL